MLINNFYHIVERYEDRITIQFNPSHPIYAAHFPSGPITPGACLVRIAEELLGQAMVSITNLKFMQPVLPMDVITFVFSKKKENQYTITIQNSETIYARFVATYLCSDTNLQ